MLITIDQNQFEPLPVPKREMTAIYGMLHSIRPIFTLYI